MKPLSMTGEELAAAVSPTYFCKGGTAVHLLEELTTFKEKKKNEFSATELAACRLRVAISCLRGLLPETKTCGGVHIRIAPL